MKKTCLILSESTDPHVLKVLDYFQNYEGWNYWVLNTAKAIEELQISLSFDSQHSEWKGVVNSIDLTTLGSIWYRRPTRPQARKDQFGQTFSELAEAETRAFLHNLYQVVPCRILPHPTADRQADHKLLQLKVAASVGFQTPRSYITNDPSLINQLPDGAGAWCIKPMSAFHWWKDSQSEYALRSARVSKNDLEKYSKDLLVCPTLIQEYISKKYEWRITVVDRKVFACRLDTQFVPGAEEDWRLVNVDLISHEMMPISNQLENQLHKYLDAFGLNFGAFDFIEQPDGEFVFLECNPNGQWLWIELRTGAPISKAIADYLFYS